MIEFENVTRRYGQKVAVSELNLTVPDGELFALLGPNGAGKTTTIKMLVGLLRPSAGAVRVGGFDLVTHTRNAASHIGYVPDEPYLYDKLSGREFLEFVTRMRGMDSRRSAEAIEEVTAHFELDSFLDELAETYSHGMKQRLVLASALLHDPAVLVVDEPMVGLDPKSARMVKDLLQERVRAGRTVFMSTHTLALAEEIANRIGIVDAGRLDFLGTLEELRQHLSSNHKSLEQLFLQLTGNGNGNGQSGAPSPEVARRPRADA